jgi:hypothetical protein
MVCFANLLLEILLTRIFSATLYYHFTFLAVALALLGMSASGVYVYVRSARFTAERAADDLAFNARAFAVSTVVALVYLLVNPIDLGIGGATQRFTSQTFFQLLILAIASGLPFFFAGMIVSLAVFHFRDSISRVYAFDLAGASLGAVALGALLRLVGAPSAVLAVAVMAALAALLFRRPRRRDVVWALAMLTIFVANLNWSVIRVYSGKGVKSERLLFEAWNSFSRVTVERVKGGELDIKIDASAATRITSAELVPKRAQAGHVSAFAYGLFPAGADNVMIIGAGGGIDVVNALAAGARKVVAVEINPLIAKTVMLDRFIEESGRLYRDPRVELVIDEGRSYVRRSDRTYDVIQATLVDTWAATASGAFALTESNLYTVEAFADYYTHLTPRGVLTMSRWHTGRDPETARLLVVAAAGLTRLGVPGRDVRRHIVFASKDSLGTLVAKRTPFSEAEIAMLRAVATRHKFELVVAPDNNADNRFQRLVDEGPYSSYVARDKRDLSPPTDDRPFFFYFVKAGDFFDLGRGELVNPAMWILIAFGVTIVMLVGAFLLVPLFFLRRDVIVRGGWGAIRFRMVALAYFCAIGFGFIVIEIALMQKLGLFLGHPTYGLVVVLFSILLATAAGARMSGAVKSRIKMAAIGGGVVALIAFLYAARLGAFLDYFVAYPLVARGAVAATIVALPGCLMGFLLPLAVAWLAERDAEVIPWGWGLNGASSVLGTVTAIIIAIHAGFDATLAAGGAAYVVAIATLLLLSRLRSPA